MKAAFIVYLLLFQAGFALANQEPARAGTACGWLMTEAECMRHRQTLAELNDPDARMAYLERHLAMLREREVMCACAAERQAMARAQYR